MTEPVFRYHPDPLATGSAMRIEHECSICGQLRQIRYRGPIYGGQPETLCLHCIYSGEASRALGVVAVATDGSDILDMPAEFSDAIDVPDDVPHHVIEEITRRTPGFTGWQQESWLYHCGDGAAFLGPAGYRDVEPHPEALNMLRASHRQLGWSPEETEEFLHRLDRNGEPTAYLFQCLHCRTHLASWDIG
ncbi:CbrC family protein [Micromonospora sp. bgisy143]|uniref:CbrC family protein n=1 Tax=Micromonospora sp. bgisy143 TaxID=3413790 RepID=UPI003EBEBC27